MKTPETHIAEKTFIPSWLADFACLGGRCPKTCCAGWNIPVDDKHAEFYTQMDDVELAPVFSNFLRKMHVKRKHSEEDTWHFHLMGMPGMRCPFLNEAGLCRIQCKFGENALCDTCYFFPRNAWQIDDMRFMSASLSCPEVLRRMILPTEPTAFVWTEAASDAQTEWLETDMIQDDASRLLLQNRQILIETIVAIFQDRSHNAETRVFLVCTLLQKLYKAIESINGENFASWLRDNATEMLGTEGTDLEAGSLGSQEEGLMIAMADTFDWAMDGAIKPLEDIHDVFSQLLIGHQDRQKVIARNYAAARDQLWLPYIRPRMYQLENFLVNFAFSDMFRQFALYRDEQTSAAHILRYEISQLAAVFSLMKVVVVKNCVCEGKIDEASFLRSLYEFDNSYLHYPMYIRKSIQRMPDVLSQPQIIPLMLAC